MKRFYLLAALLFLIAAGLTQAWWAIGHARIAEAATAGVPNEMPKFFRAAAKQLGHMSGDPDRWKNPACKFLRVAEAPDHFIDLEDFGGKQLPTNRWKAISLLQKLGKQPDRVGFLPYAVMENYDRLSCAFYDYRADKINPAVQAKCIVYAGVLSHLTGDSSMPLHTTIHYDGRVNLNVAGKAKPGRKPQAGILNVPEKAKPGRKPQAGIHAKIDAFPEKFGMTAEEMARGLKAKEIEDVWSHVVKQIEESHKLIDRCYALDKSGAFDKPTKESRQFILDRCRVGTQFTMDLWYTAWLRSAHMPKPW